MNPTIGIMIPVQQEICNTPMKWLILAVLSVLLNTIFCNTARNNTNITIFYLFKYQYISLFKICTMTTKLRVTWRSNILVKPVWKRSHKCLKNVYNANSVLCFQYFSSVKYLMGLWIRGNMQFNFKIKIFLNWHEIFI